MCLVRHPDSQLTFSALTSSCQLDHLASVLITNFLAREGAVWVSGKRRSSWQHEVLIM